MRENHLSGSEGGAPRQRGVPTPIISEWSAGVPPVWLRTPQFIAMCLSSAHTFGTNTVQQRGNRMSGMPITKSERYTWDDYRSWDDDQRYEIIGGELFNMTPAPRVQHQRVCGSLFSALHEHFAGRKCSPLVSPIDLKLSEQDTVQPDIVVVCDPSQIKDTHIEGPPRLVIEIASPSTLRHDRVRKFTLYQSMGVAEYWLVTPYPSLIEIFVLSDTRFQLATGYEAHQTLSSPTFPDLSLELAPIFDFPIDPNERVEMVKETQAPYSATL